MEKKRNWMIYGAYGYTGALLAREAVERGHRPVLAGRSKEKLLPLAEELKLPWMAVDLAPGRLAAALQGVNLVLHAAGPFLTTSAPMLEACLKSGTHYLDITGEVPVFEHVFEQDAVAQQAGVALIPGVGLDVIPSDCLAAYVAAKMPEAERLEIAVSAGLASAGPGTQKTSLEMLTKGGLVRQGGKLAPVKLRAIPYTVQFYDKPRTVLRAPWGDLASAYRSTGIPNITTYLAYSRKMIKQMRYTLPLAPYLLKITPLRKLISAWVGKTVHGPDEAQREKSSSHFWARATAPDGRQTEAWLETRGAYQVTAVGALLSVERVLESDLCGAFTPSQAFGMDFVLEIPGARRYDALPGAQPEPK